MYVMCVYFVSVRLLLKLLHGGHGGIAVAFIWDLDYGRVCGQFHRSEQCLS